MLFATASLARRIERAEATLIAECAQATGERVGEENVFIRWIGSAVAVQAGDGAPFNKVAGLGFDGVPDSAAMDDIERELAIRRTPVQAEVSTLADPGVSRMLTGRGYVLVGFENVLGRALDRESLDDEQRRPANPAIAIAREAPADRKDWLNAVLTGFLHQDTFDGPASHESFDPEVLTRVYEDMSRARGFERQLARIDGQVAGGASLRICDGVAQLCGAATLPQYRRRGVQSALLRYRLADAASRGCDVAVVTTQPGSRSQQNVQRAGFDLLYARAILVKNADAAAAG